MKSKRVVKAQVQPVVSLPPLSPGFQRYALNQSWPHYPTEGPWTILEALIPCIVGQGNIIKKNLSYRQMRKLLG